MYTGASRQRFNKAGRGKGICGRRDVLRNDGYVTGYADKGTYNATHTLD